MSCKNREIDASKLMLPYAPPKMYTEAMNIVIMMEKTLFALVNRALSSGSVKSTVIISEPAKSWRINPAVTIGPIPSSVNVPRVEAKITLI